MSTVRPSHRLAMVVQAALLASLAAAVAFAAHLQQAPWPDGRPPAARTVAAVAIAVAYLAACLALWVRSRRHRPVDTGMPGTAAAPLVLHASQTGFALRLAELTAQRLRDGGLAPEVGTLGGCHADTLASSERALFVVSTTGEGDPPDGATAFVETAMLARPDLRRLRYGLLALGDRRYARYCAFGHTLEAWLRHCGAQPLFDLVEVDGGDGGALRRWQHDLDRLAGTPIAAAPADWSPPRYQRWRLETRRELNPGSLGGAAFELRLCPPDGALAWSPGDIAEIGPRHAPDAVAAWLRAHALDGDAQVGHDDDGRPLPLHALLARSRWPDPAAADGFRDMRAFADSLEPLPHREYSIASIPAEGHLRLLVRRMRRPDGEPGLGSGWLCDHARIGESIALRIRANPNFRPGPPERAPILIGNGTGLAGLRAHLAARSATGATGAWLFFGERQRTHDLFWDDELARWRDDGTLARAEFAFSRDGGPVRYVQDALLAAGDALRARVADGAELLVCGNATGMAPAVEAVLAQVLGEETLTSLRDAGRYRRDVY